MKRLTIISVICLAFSALSCTDKVEDSFWDDSVVGTLDISGKVTDTDGIPLAQATISCIGTDTNREVRKTGQTNADGTYLLEKVPSNARYIKFSKEGYASVAYTIESKRFKQENEIELNPSLQFSRAIITGFIIDAATDEPMQGVLVSNGVRSARTDENGKYSVEKLTVKDYSLTYTTPDGASYSRSVAAVEFVNNVVTVPTLRLGGEDVWPGRKWQELADAPYWYGNENRGSTGFSGRNDWSLGYMSAWPYYGDFRYEAEGCALLISGGYGKEGDMDNFNAYTYGRKLIYEGNRYMNVSVRTHGPLVEEDAIWFGVQVLDLTENKTKAEKIGYGHMWGDQYRSFAFDLGDYIGHEVVIGYGVYWKEGTSGHLPTRRIAFTSEPLEGTEDNMTGEKFDGMTGWAQFTKENILTQSINYGTDFSGKNFGFNTTNGENGVQRTHNPGGQQGYSGFAGTNHILMSWTYYYVNTVPEPLDDKGYIIKSLASGSANYNSPAGYLTSRFHITPANDHLYLYVRSDNLRTSYETAFRVTGSTDDGVSVALTPCDVRADKASAIENGNGCWSLIHGRGKGNPDDYALFTYDLSSFMDKNLAITISVHKSKSADESRLAIYRIMFD